MKDYITVLNKPGWDAVEANDPSFFCQKPEPNAQDYPVGLTLQGDDWTWEHLDLTTMKPK